MFDNLLFAEPLLIDAVRDAVPEFKTVKSWAEVPETIEAVGATPAAFVVYEGSAKAESVGGAATLSRQFWTVAVLIRRGQTTDSLAVQREEAGKLLAQVYNALQGLRLEGCRPLSLVDGPTVQYYPGGQAIFYLTFQLESPLLPR